MLKQEMDKANKKIEETRNKTTELRKIREENDKNYLKKIHKEKQDAEVAKLNRQALERKI